MNQLKLNHQVLNRKHRTRLKLKRVGVRARLQVFRSNQHTYAEIIDGAGKTLTSVSEKEVKDLKGTKMERAAKVGELIAAKALKLKVKLVYFDRGPYKYHGRIKSLAEAARKIGLEF